MDDNQSQTSPLVNGAPTCCKECGTVLCLRKQVINLALGNTAEMWCLVCLAKENSQSPEELLAGLSSYILSRECFAQQWKRYPDVKYCPDRDGCLPGVCFGPALE